MSNTQKNVPELRFPGFEDEWEEKKIGDITTKIGSGKTPKGGSENYLDKGIPFFRSQNVQNGNLYLDDLVYIDSKVDEEMKNSRSYYGDILLNITGASIGRSAINNINYTHVNLNQHVCIIRVVNNISHKFLASFLLSKNGQKKIFLAQSGGSREGLNFKEISNIKCSFPISYKEQQKIGDFFSKLDKQIELEEKKLELLEQQKKGYMQKIFSQELRFKDQNGNDYPEWKTKKLEEIGKFNSGIGFPEKYQGGNIGTPFFKVSDMNLESNKNFMKKANNYVTDIQIKEKKWKVINELPAVIFAKVGAAIMLNRKRIVTEPFLIDNNTMSYSFSDQWDMNFGSIFFQTLNLPKYAQVGALPSYNSKDIGSISIDLPSLDVQKKIGDFFYTLNKTIESQSTKIELLKQRKQGLLQKMFV